MDWNGLLDGMTRLIADTFPEPISYYRVSTDTTHTVTVTGAPLTGVFDYEAVETREGASLGVNNRQTVVDIRLADLGFEPESKDRVEIAGKTYDVLTKHPTTSGMMKLYLRKR